MFIIVTSTTPKNRSKRTVSLVEKPTPFYWMMKEDVYRKWAFSDILGWPWCDYTTCYLINHTSSYWGSFGGFR